MGATQTRTWHAAAYLRTEEDMIAYLDAVLVENDSDLTVAALSDIASALGTLTVDEDWEESDGN